MVAAIEEGANAASAEDAGANAASDEDAGWVDN